MIQPRRDEFEGAKWIATYRTVAPAVLQVRDAPKSQSFAAGAVVEVVGLPNAALMPLNSEGVYAKVHAISRAVKSGWVDDIALLAISLGAPFLPREDARVFINNWLDNPQPIGASS